MKKGIQLLGAQEVGQRLQGEGLSILTFTRAQQGRYVPTMIEASPKLGGSCGIFDRLLLVHCGPLHKGAPLKLTTVQFMKSTGLVRLELYPVSYPKCLHIDRTSNAF